MHHRRIRLPGSQIPGVPECAWGVEMVSALVVGMAIGWGLDRWLHTLPLFLIVFVLLGGAAGIANVWRTVGPKR